MLAPAITFGLIFHVELFESLEVPCVVETALAFALVESRNKNILLRYTQCWVLIIKCYVSWPFATYFWVTRNVDYLTTFG